MYRQCRQSIFCGTAPDIAAFYVVVALLFALLLRLALALTEPEAGRAVCAVLLIGLLPPLIAAASGGAAGPSACGAAAR